MSNRSKIKPVILPRDEFKPTTQVTATKEIALWPGEQEAIIKVIYSLQQNDESRVEEVLANAVEPEQTIYRELIRLWQEDEQVASKLIQLAEKCTNVILRHWIYIMLAEYWIEQGEQQKLKECLVLMEEKEGKESAWAFTQQYKAIIRIIAKIKFESSDSLAGNELNVLKITDPHPQIAGMRAYIKALRVKFPNTEAESIRDDEESGENEGEEKLRTKASYADYQQYINTAISIFSEQGASPNVYWWAKSVIAASKQAATSKLTAASSQVKDINAYTVINKEILGVRAGKDEETLDIYQLSLAINKLRKMGKSAIVAEASMIIEANKKVYQESRRIGKYLVGNNKALEEKIKRLAQSEKNILILGETGTGKTLIAKEIHSHPLSPRRERQFVSVNCGSLRPEIALAELCGTAKGGFTNATERRGLIEEAGNGTLFLDEIGELPAEIQAMLLTAISEKKIRRIGSNREIEVKCRIIGATNRDIINNVSYEDKHDNPFREDLVARLRGGLIIMDPLRERKADIKELAEYFISQVTDIKTRFGLLAVEELQKYHFPGNIRELRQIVEELVEEAQETYQLELANELVITQPMTRQAIGRLMIQNEESEAEPIVREEQKTDKEILKEAISKLSDLGFERSNQRFKRAIIRRALEMTDNKIGKMAEILDITRFRLNRLMKELEM